jgi:low temperature requirement protein LtrA
MTVERPAPAVSPQAADDGADERRTSPIELLWDLVFVFAVTQVTTLLAKDLTWGGLGRALLVLALVWWAWSAFVWAVNVQDARSRVLQALLLASMVLIFVSGLALPHAFGENGTLFAVTYAGVRLLHLALYADASRRGNASWAAIAGFAATVVAGMVLLVAGSLVDGDARAALWAIAALIDYAGPAWLTRERLRGVQRLAVAHFAERYSLFIIICLGESIIAAGLSAGDEELGVDVVAAVALSVTITIGLWWTYFARDAERAEQRLRTHDDPVLAAADAYSYMHLVLVAGIIIFAVGVKDAIHHVDDPLADSARLALCGGVALYLAGHAAFVLRLLRDRSLDKLVAVAALLVIFAVGSDLPAWGALAAVVVVVVVLCAQESRGGARRGSATPPA